MEGIDIVSPWASAFELETHFMANRAGAAVFMLIRNIWADFMLDPRMTSSTFIEVYSPSLPAGVP